MTAFTKLLSLAEREGYARTLLDEGEPALAILRRAATGPHGSYVTRLLLLAGESATAASRPRTTGPDDLSERSTDGVTFVQVAVLLANARPGRIGHSRPTPPTGIECAPA